MGRDKLGSYTVDETVVILWAALHSHEVMAEFSKQDIKRHPSVTSIFFRFLVTAKIYDPLQEISQMKRYIKVLITNSDRRSGRMTKLEE